MAQLRATLAFAAKLAERGVIQRNLNSFLKS
jgi:hypothetical protein